MIRKLMQSIREYKLSSLLSPLFVVLEVVMEVVIPILMAKLIDDGIAVADNNQCCELHDTTALYGLGYAVNGNHLFCKFESLRINFSQSNTSLV